MLLKTYKRLGTDKPHKPTPVKEEEAGEGTKRPLSPSESGAAQMAEQSIDVKPEEQGQMIKLGDVENALPAIDADATVTAASTEPKRRGRPRKSELAEQAATKPYEGLFDAIIQSELSPPTIEITDLRESVTGGDKSWTERLHCLICNHELE